MSADGENLERFKIRPNSYRIIFMANFGGDSLTQKKFDTILISRTESKASPDSKGLFKKLKDPI